MRCLFSPFCRDYKRYYYKHVETEECQWEYPDVGGAEEKDQSEDAKQEGGNSQSNGGAEENGAKNGQSLAVSVWIRTHFSRIIITKI